MKYLNKTITVNYNPINIGNNLEKKGYKTNKNFSKNKRCIEHTKKELIHEQINKIKSNKMAFIPSYNKENIYKNINNNYLYKNFYQENESLNPKTNNINQKNGEDNSKKEHKIKDSDENNNFFLDMNQKKSKNNSIQKKSLCIKPAKSKTKPKIKKLRIKISNEILPYRKKNNIINLTATHLSKPNESIEANKIFNENKNNYIRYSHIKNTYTNGNNKRTKAAINKNIVNESINQIYK